MHIIKEIKFHNLIILFGYNEVQLCSRKYIYMCVYVSVFVLDANSIDYQYNNIYHLPLVLDQRSVDRAVSRTHTIDHSHPDEGISQIIKH